MKKLFLFFLVVYAQNLLGSIILVNKIDPKEGRFQVYVNYCGKMRAVDLEYNQEISFDVINKRSDYLVTFKKNKISQIILNLRQGVCRFTQERKTADFFIDAHKKLKKETDEMSAKSINLKKQKIDNSYEDKVYHILLEKIDWGLGSSIVLKEQLSRS